MERCKNLARRYITAGSHLNSAKNEGLEFPQDVTGDEIKEAYAAVGGGYDRFKQVLSDLVRQEKKQRMCNKALECVKALDACKKPCFGKLGTPYQDADALANAFADEHWQTDFNHDNPMKAAVEQFACEALITQCDQWWDIMLERKKAQASSEQAGNIVKKIIAAHQQNRPNDAVTGEIFYDAVDEELIVIQRLKNKCIGWWNDMPHYKKPLLSKAEEIMAMLLSIIADHQKSTGSNCLTEKGFADAIAKKLHAQCRKWWDDMPAGEKPNFPPEKAENIDSTIALCIQRTQSYNRRSNTGVTLQQFKTEVGEMLTNQCWGWCGHIPESQKPVRHDIYALEYVIQAHQEESPNVSLTNEIVAGLMFAATIMSCQYPKILFFKLSRPQYFNVLSQPKGFDVFRQCQALSAECRKWYAEAPMGSKLDEGTEFEGGDPRCSGWKEATLRILKMHFQRCPNDPVTRDIFVGLMPEARNIRILQWLKEIRRSQKPTLEPANMLKAADLPQSYVLMIEDAVAKHQQKIPDQPMDNRWFREFLREKNGEEIVGKSAKVNLLYSSEYIDDVIGKACPVGSYSDNIRVKLIREILDEILNFLSKLARRMHGYLVTPEYFRKAIAIFDRTKIDGNRLAEKFLGFRWKYTKETWTAQCNKWIEVLLEKSADCSLNGFDAASLREYTYGYSDPGDAVKTNQKHDSKPSGGTGRSVQFGTCEYRPSPYTEDDIIEFWQ